MDNCEICRRIESFPDNPYFVCETETGYVVLGDSQYIPGYTVFICKEHVMDMNDLSDQYRAKFMEEMFDIGNILSQVYEADHMNYALLGCEDLISDTRHVHWHLIPRHNNDIEDNKPLWSVPVSERNSPEYIPDDEELFPCVERLKEAARSCLEMFDHLDE